MTDISTRIKKVVVDKLGVDESEVVPSANFASDLGADSLDTVELVMELEKEFSIDISDSEAEQLDTVGKVIEFVESHQKN
jgi:acyl carrier protein